MPLLLYDGAEEIEEHPLLDLLCRPSPDHTGTDFLESWYGYPAGCRQCVRGSGSA